MAVSGGFGIPARPLVEPARLKQSEEPQLLILTVIANVGGFQRAVPLAAGVNDGVLQNYLKEWLTDPHNRRSYIGPTQIVKLPFLE